MQKDRENNSDNLKPMTTAQKVKNWVIIILFILFAIIFLTKSSVKIYNTDLDEITRFFNSFGLIILGIILKFSKYNKKMFGPFQRYWYVFIVLGICLDFGMYGRELLW